MHPTANDDMNIKTMKLYTNMDRITNELLELQSKEIAPSTSALDVELLSTIDSMHYLGNTAIKNGITRSKITRDCHVLDLGSGLGGPARMLTHLTHCSVDALELQPDLHALAQSLTRQCGLDIQVQHIQGNFMTRKIVPETYDAIMSWLVFLHIPDRMPLLKKCHTSLKPGGVLYVEDYFMKHPFTPTEKTLLVQDVFVQQLPSYEETKNQLCLNGFEIVDMTDVTEEWAKYVATRLSRYTQELERHAKVHGKKGAHDLMHFYTSVNTLFEGGNLGGVIYTARKICA